MTGPSGPPSLTLVRPGTSFGLLTVAVTSTAPGAASSVLLAESAVTLARPGSCTSTVTSSPPTATVRSPACSNVRSNRWVTRSPGWTVPDSVATTRPSTANPASYSVAASPAFVTVPTTVSVSPANSVGVDPSSDSFRKGPPTAKVSGPSASPTSTLAGPWCAFSRENTAWSDRVRSVASRIRRSTSAATRLPFR
ncbi:hypothetical protein BRD06_09210 [Halobacteriales archaeon QS_9_67_15]|nr:MAG: hypothetical protein BRD06_09210 [Halobacteriales archaeon QS_9_67_15]